MPMMKLAVTCLSCILLVNEGKKDNELTPDEGRRLGPPLRRQDARRLDDEQRRSRARRPWRTAASTRTSCGDYMLVHKEDVSDFVLSLDFKISKRCNSGIFIRTFSLKPRPGKDVGFNGIEVAIDDTTGAGFHDTGAIYDLVKPKKNAMKPAGEWNHIVITCDRNDHRGRAERREGHAHGPRRVDGAEQAARRHRPQVRRGLQGPPAQGLHRPAGPRRATAGSRTSS